MNVDIHPRLRAALIAATWAALACFLAVAVIMWDLRWPAPTASMDAYDIKARSAWRFVWVLVIGVAALIAAVTADPE